MGLAGLLSRCLRGRDWDRNIFQFWSGNRTWYGIRRIERADPFELSLGLMEHPDFTWSDLESLKSPADSDIQLRWRLEAISKLSVIVRQVFGIKTLEDGGLSNFECVKLLIDFQAWMGLVKKNGVEPHNSQLPAESIQAVTRADTESGSTEQKSDSGEPTGQPQEPLGQSQAKSA